MDTCSLFIPADIPFHHSTSEFYWVCTNANACMINYQQQLKLSLDQRTLQDVHDNHEGNPLLLFLNHTGKMLYVAYDIMCHLKAARNYLPWKHHYIITNIIDNLHI